MQMPHFCHGVNEYLLICAPPPLSITECSIKILHVFLSRRFFCGQHLPSDSPHLVDIAMQISVHGAASDGIHTGELCELTRRGEGMMYFGADDAFVLGLFRILPHKCIDKIE